MEYYLELGIVLHVQHFYLILTWVIIVVLDSYTKELQIKEKLEKNELSIDVLKIINFRVFL